MIKVRTGISNSQEDTVTVDVFDSVTELHVMMEMLKLEADGIRSGKSTHETGKCVDVILHPDGEITAEVITELFPSFSEWMCKTCRGTKLTCGGCAGEGWDVSGEPNGFGRYVKKINIGDHSMFVLVVERYWIQEEEDDD